MENTLIEAYNVFDNKGKGMHWNIYIMIAQVAIVAFWLDNVQ